jgi:hypothetical protein
LASFISRAKHELTIYDSDGGFSSDTWYHILKGGKRSSIAFKEFESSRGKSDGAVFKQPFLDFARAYVREQQSIKRVACSGSMIPDTNVGGNIATINEVSDDQKATFFFS